MGEASLRFPAFLMALMFLASAIALPSSTASAQQATEPSEEAGFRFKAEVLIGLAEKAKIQIDMSITANVTTSEEAKSMYDAGVSALNEARKLEEQGRHGEACEKAVEAMKNFKDALAMICETAPPAKPSEAEAKAEKAIGLKVAVERAIAYADELGKLAHTVEAEEGGYNATAGIKGKIAEAEVMLNVTLRLLDEGKVDDAAEKLGDARRLLSECMAEYRETVAQQVRLKMAEKFIDEAGEEVGGLKEKVLLVLGGLPWEKREKIESLITNATSKVEEARGRVKRGVGELPSVVPILNEVMREIRESKSEVGERELLKAEALIDVEKLQAQILRLNERVELLERFGVNITNTKGMINEAEGLLDAAKTCAERGDVEKAKEVVEKARDLVGEIDKRAFEVLEKVEGGKPEVAEELRAKASEELEKLQGRLGEIEARVAELKAKNVTAAELEQLLIKAKEALKQAREKVESGSLTTICQVVCPVEDVVYRLEKSLEWLERTKEKWVPYMPVAGSVEVNIRQVMPSLREVLPRVIAEVAIVFPHAGFRVDWGGVERDGTVFTVDARVEEWTGPSAQVIVRKTHMYALGELEPGTYVFILKANGETLVIKQFEVEAQTSPLKPRIIDILRNPEVYKGKTITVTGT